MILLAALAGLLAGTLIAWAADVLPRFSTNRPDDLPAHPRLSVAVAEALAARVDLRGWLRAPGNGLRLGLELASALFFAYLWGQYGLAWHSLLLAGAAVFFVLIAMIDLRYRLVLDVLTYPVMALLLARLALMPEHAGAALIGGAFGFGLFFLTALVKPGGMGGGDIKLATLIGLAFGFPLVFWPLMIGIGAGGVVSVVLLARRRGLGTHIPYAPFLCLGALAALLANPLAGRVWF